MGIVLSADEVERYEREGYLSPVDGLSTEEVGRYRASFDELNDYRGGKMVPIQCAQLHLYFPWAYELALHPRILDTVEDLLGEDIIVHSSTIFCKYPNDLRFVSWHQDGHYRGFDSRRSVSAWVALSESTPRNGCVRVIPGSHRTLYEHREYPDAANMLLSGMTIDAPDGVEEASDMVLAPGQFSLHHVDLVHSSGPNPTDDFRIGMAVRYIAADVRQTLPHHAVLLARGRDTAGHFRLLDQIPTGTTAECADRQWRAQTEYMRVRGMENAVADIEAEGPR